jgi:hypothetical protein
MINPESNYGYLGITNTATGQPEYFRLWGTSTDHSVLTLVRQSMWVSLLREATSNKLNVTITFKDDSSSSVEEVLLGTL